MRLFYFEQIPCSLHFWQHDSCPLNQPDRRRKERFAGFFRYYGKKPNLKTTMAIPAQYVELYPLLRQYKAKKTSNGYIHNYSMSAAIFFCNKESGLF
jgi:hypothetical protein